MKRILISILLITILCGIPFAASAKNPIITDNAGLLTDSEIAELTETASQLINTYNVDIAIVTVGSLDGKSAQAYADDYYDYNGYGIGKKGSGVLLLYCPEYRDCAISTCGSAIQAIRDSDINTILDNMASSIRSENYVQAFRSFLSGVEFCFEQTDLEDQEDLKGTIIYLLIALAISAAVAGIVLYFLKKKMNTAVACNGAANYMDSASFEMYRASDIYLYSSVSRIRRAENSSSGGRSGSSVHSSSSGRSHGGGSRRF